MPISLVDVDHDGDLDLFIGEQVGDQYGRTLFPQQRFCNRTRLPEAGNTPFGIANVGYSHSPAFADIDGDGDQISSSAMEMKVAPQFSTATPQPRP